MTTEEHIYKENVKNLSKLYDEYASEIKGYYVNSLPNMNKGKNLTSYQNFYSVLRELDLIGMSEMRLYIRSQYDMLWKMPRWNKKVIPINMMYSTGAVRRFINFVELKTEKIGKTRIHKFLEHYANTPLVKDDNTASLMEDIRLMYNYLSSIVNSGGTISNKEVLKGVILIETRKILSINKKCICPAYLYTNPHIDLKSVLINKYFKNKIDIIQSSIKKRGKTYINSLYIKKDSIVDDIIKDLPPKQQKLFKKYL